MERIESRGPDKVGRKVGGQYEKGEQSKERSR